MKMTVVPAQVTTVEDRIIGSLGFSQILLLVIPIFINAGIFALLPPFLGNAIYKYVLMGLVAIIFCVLAIRIKGKVLAFWLVTILRYNLRPKYYLFNKNTLAQRENYPAKKEQIEPETATAEKSKRQTTRKHLDIPATARALATLENPAAKVRFETGKKGNLHVRLTEIEE
jgi:hypothetical protein